MEGILIHIIIAFLLDLLIGDPEWFPHPIKCIGKFINYVEKILRKIFITNSMQKIGGVILAIIVISITYSITWSFIKTIKILVSSLKINQFYTDILIGIIGSFTLALKGLRKEAKNILFYLERDISIARLRLKRIVGRDVERLDKNGIIRATIESLSENLSDGVIAPLFYFAIGGVPLAMAYKSVNTLDSMVGYKNKKYIYFGWASAKIDDIANFLPSRITAALLIIIGFLMKPFYPSLNPFNAIITVIKYGMKHPSPNAGNPISAIAGLLSLKLAGPDYYDGKLKIKPYIGDGKKEFSIKDGKLTIKLITYAAFIGWFLTIFILLFLINQ